MGRATAITLSIIVMLGAGRAVQAADDEQNCPDCSNKDAVETPNAGKSQSITLFAPGQFDSEWLYGDHPGAQSLRQGQACQDCHQGEEPSMGENIAERGHAASREVDISFAIDQDQLLVTLAWRESPNDQRISIMWGNGGNAAFSRTGCWASCHSDMAGMSEDNGRQQGKYLEVAKIGRSAAQKTAASKSAADLEALLAAGAFVEIWQANTSAKDEAIMEGGLILDDLHWYPRHPVTGKASYKKGRWSVIFKRPLAGGPGGSKSFLPGKRYTFGIGLHGSQEENSKHWVSLPISFSLDGEETAFTAAPQ